MAPERQRSFYSELNPWRVSLMTTAVRDDRRRAHLMELPTNMRYEPSLCVTLHPHAVSELAGPLGRLEPRPCFQPSCSPGDVIDSWRPRLVYAIVTGLPSTHRVRRAAAREIGGAADIGEGPAMTCGVVGIEQVLKADVQALSPLRVEAFDDLRRFDVETH